MESSCPTSQIAPCHCCCFWGHSLGSRASMLPHSHWGDLPGGVLQDVSAVKREDAGPGLQLALRAGEQGLPAGKQRLVLQREGTRAGSLHLCLHPAEGPVAG